LIQELRSRSDIFEIRGTYEIARITPVETLESNFQVRDTKSTRVIEWNIEHINAPLAWNITKGEGVVVANIDTGVRYFQFSFFNFFFFFCIRIFQFFFLTIEKLM